MVLPSTNIEGYRLVIAVYSTPEFYHFPLPNNSKELQQIDDFLLTKANYIEYHCEDLNLGVYYQINSYSEFQECFRMCRNAQGLTLAVKLENRANDNKPWKCCNCQGNNDANSLKCKICSRDRKFKGGVKKFDI